MIACAPGRAHRLRARDRAAPSERDGAIGHDNCASVFLHTTRRRSGAGPPHARSRRGRPARAAEGRRAVALVSEIATPSNTSSPLSMAITPPFACTRTDAESFHSGLTLMGTIMDVTLTRIRRGVRVRTRVCACARVCASLTTAPLMLAVTHTPPPGRALRVGLPGHSFGRGRLVSCAERSGY